MRIKMCLSFLILCGILSQGIIGSFAEEDIKESSAILVRQKRVFSRVSHENVNVPIDMRPYIVQIIFRNNVHCAGSILTEYYVITSPYCAQGRVSLYSVISGAPSMYNSNHNTHRVREIKIKYANIPGRPLDGVALLRVTTPFQDSDYSHAIELYTGDLFPYRLANISGWGLDCTDDRQGLGTNFTYHLRSIEVPILKHRDCLSRYRSIHIITDKDVCTYHRYRKCGHYDGGAPLVIDNHLAGIYLWSGQILGGNDPEYPAVFSIVQESEYRRWILNNLRHN